MNSKIFKALLLAAGLAPFSGLAQQPLEPPDPEKVSYALGMNLGLQIKRMGADVDVKLIIQAINDVMEGKPTQVPESEIRAIFQQEETTQRTILSKKNQEEGDAFLAKNAKAPGVTVLPDGLQYRVIKEGTGETPKEDDSVTINFRGMLVNGQEIDHKDHFQAVIGTQIKGWQEALQLMKVGSKWQVVIPPALAFGRNWMGQIGPDSTVIFEIELLSRAPRAERTATEPPGGRQTRHVVGDVPPTNAAPKSILSPAPGK